MSNINFMCVADAIRVAQDKFDQTLESAVMLAISHMSAEDLRDAFFQVEGAAQDRCIAA